jgi:hypothetical protein
LIASPIALDHIASAGLKVGRNDPVVTPVHRLHSDPLATAEENALAQAIAESRAGHFTGPGWAPIWHGDEQNTSQT